MKKQNEPFKKINPSSIQDFTKNGLRTIPATSSGIIQGGKTLTPADLSMIKAAIAKKAAKPAIIAPRLIAPRPIAPVNQGTIDLTDDNQNGNRSRPAKKRRRGSDSDESSDEDSKTLLKVRFYMGWLYAPKFENFPPLYAEVLNFSNFSATTN